MALVLHAWDYEVRAAETITADGDFQNIIYLQAPNVTNTSLTQTKAITIFSGYVPANPPTDGQFLLTESALGHPVGKVGVADFYFGQEIVPDPEFADRVDKSLAPGIDPAGSAFYVPELDKLYGSNPGYVTVTWRGTSGNVATVRYLISGLPDPNKPVVAVYHTHPADGNLTDAPGTYAPVVDLKVFESRLLYNAVIPDTTFLRVTTGSTRHIYAKARTGLILLELRENGQFRGLEIVEVRDNESAGVTLEAIGSRIEPPAGQNVVEPIVTIGGLDSKIPAKNDYVYQHALEGPQKGHVFAIKQTLLGNDIEVYWMREGAGAIRWPYALRRYTADWPTDSNKRQIYVRGAQTLGPEVVIPGPAEVMAFQVPPNHAPPVAGGRFSTTGPGLCLLKYAPSNAVSFQVVQSVLNTDPMFNQGEEVRPIGQELTSAQHQAQRPGYIYKPAGDKYDWETYEGQANNPPGWDPTWTTGQIIPVNQGSLEVWWYNTNQGVAWPSMVKRYSSRWLDVTDTIVIASQQGTGVIDPATSRNFRFYYQNDSTRVGFNPNDEHALIGGLGAGQAIFALRSDLRTATTSEPYVLMKFQDPTDNNRWRMKVYEVVAEESPATFHYHGRAGNLMQPPYPLQAFCKPDNRAVSGPVIKDRKGDFWATAAGDIVMRWFYSANATFYFPDAPHQRAGQCIPWLDREAGTPGVPIGVTYTVYWPDNIPEELVAELGPNSEVPVLNVGETLIDPKRGLPAIDGQCSVEIWHESSPGSVTLIDPIKTRRVGLGLLPGDVAVENVSGKMIFSKLPPHLRERLSYNPVTFQLEFQGLLRRPAAGGPYLLPNIITARERAILADPQIMGADPSFQTALMSLASQSAMPLIVPPGASDFDGLALSAGSASGEGYVTLGFGNNEAPCGPASPVSVQIIKVSCPLTQGSIRVVKSDSPFDEMLTLRWDGELAGQSDRYQFEWRWRADEDGTQPPRPDSDPNGWQSTFPVQPADGRGAVDITIAGPGRFTLSDNWFTCRYRPIANPVCLPGAAPTDPRGWSEWTAPQLAEGWIKRVISGINQFDQRFKNLGDPTRTLNTLVTMISQAGKRWEGNIPLSVANIDDYGLIEIYETIFRRGISFSIEGNPPADDPAVNKALLLAAGRLADLYMLLGNEAFADAADPTVGFSPDLPYAGAPSSIHAFMNQTANLLEEELNLLRGRDDRQAPGVEVTPFYNRMVWNFALAGDGEVAYVLNYDIQDAPGAIDGFLTEDDAKVFYPQAHGDAWGHYLTAIKEYYRLLRHPNYTWVPKSEAVLIGGVPVTVDFFDERKFARAAAAKARTGAEIVSLTYRSLYSEDPAQQWHGYTDTRSSPRSSKIATPEPRAWGLAEWGSRAGQGTFLDWVVGNAIVPEEYHDGYRITDATMSELDRQTSYDLTDQVLTNSIAVEASGMSAHTLNQLLSMPTRVFQGRSSFLSALDAVITIPEREKYQSVILKHAQTGGVPQVLLGVMDILKGNQYYGASQLRSALEAAVGTTLVAQYYESAILPYIHIPSGVISEGIQRIDRTTVTELREVGSLLDRIQAEVDKADVALNPLGLVKDMIPFDIDPVQVDQGKSHFEQIYDRAVQALNNAIAVFNRANNTTQALRRQMDERSEFDTTVRDREADFKSRLIELFGYPYQEDIGGGGTYAAGYTGADIYHYMYVDPSELIGEPPGPILTLAVDLTELNVSADGTLTQTVRPVTYHLSRTGFGTVKPPGWTTRRAPGEMQMARGELIQAKARFSKALLEYHNLITQIEDQADLLQAQYGLNAEEIGIQTAGLAINRTLNDEIRKARERMLDFQTKARMTTLVANAIAEMLPLVAGLSFDVTSVIRGGINLASSIVSEVFTQEANRESLVELDHQQTKEIAQAESGIELTTLRADFAIQQQLLQLRQLVRSEAGLRLELYSLQETMQQAAGRYASTLARGERLLDEFLRFRQNTAADVQENRYKDMAFRIFRNDALQKYRAQFDLAAAYVFMTARAYDYETTLLKGDARGAALAFLNDIVRTRAIGVIQDGLPQTGSSEGDPGLADPMARLSANWLVLEGGLGFNNPQNEQNRFSLRREHFRISNGGLEADQRWRETLARHVVPNVLDVPEFQRFARVFEPHELIEPAIVIPFDSIVEFGLNFFGEPLGAGDSAYDSSNFATKIRSVGVWFANYDITGLANTPRVYLLPVGVDRLRSATDGQTTLDWRVLDQRIPVPFPLSGNVENVDWIPVNDTLGGSTLADIRRFSSFRAYHDSGTFRLEEVTKDSRLIGRSVWNERWLLVIPAGTLGSDRTEALERFIRGRALPNGSRDGNGVNDILLLFQTYAHSGN